MRLNLDTVIHDSDFLPMRDGDKPPAGQADERPVTTLRAVIRRALLAPLPGEDKLSEDEKFQRFLLAKKVHEAKLGEEFTEAERVMILACARKGYTTLVYGQIMYAIDKSKEAERAAGEKGDKSKPRANGAGAAANANA